MIGKNLFKKKNLFLITMQKHYYLPENLLLLRNPKKENAFSLNL